MMRKAKKKHLAAVQEILRTTDIYHAGVLDVSKWLPRCVEAGVTWGHTPEQTARVMVATSKAYMQAVSKEGIL